MAATVEMNESVGRKQAGRFRLVFRRLKRNRMAIVGLVILIALALAAVFADYVAPYHFAKQNLMSSYESPSWKHLFGTDEFGRDIFSRVVYGARTSLIIGFIAVGFGVVTGGLLGAVSGFYSGRLDNFIMRCMDVLLSIPETLLAIAIAATLGPGMFNLMVAVGIASIPGYARMVRSVVLSIREQEFIEAARAVGSSDVFIIFRHILPNCMAPLIVQATLGVGAAIFTAAGLSFIGLGIQPPDPEWGAMLSGGRSYIRDYPYMTIFPGLAIMITVLAMNFLGDGLRDALDPKLKR